MNPRRLLPSMSLLVAFDASARHLSFKRASEELSLTPSVVSRQVQSLEAHLSVHLFDRGGRGLALSDAGKAYHDEIFMATRRIRKASIQAMSSADQDRELHLAVFSSFASQWLMPRIDRFYARHPRTLLHVHVNRGMHGFVGRRIDAVIGSADFDQPDIRRYHLIDEVVVPVASPALKSGLRHAADVRKMLLLWQEGSSRSDLWHRWFVQQHLDPRDIKLGPSFEVGLHLVQAVVSGIGLGLFPSFLMEIELASGLLCPVFDAPMKTGYAFYLHVPNSKIDSAPVAAFTNWILEEIAVESGARPDGHVATASP